MNAVATPLAEPSAVAWGAVIAGAVGATAMSLVLLLLGGGLGFAIISPWSARGISDDAAAASTIAWITVVQLLASALGGEELGGVDVRLHVPLGRQSPDSAVVFGSFDVLFGRRTGSLDV